MAGLPAWAYEGRWALVTGASAGIGEVFARALAARGMNLVLTARREDRLVELGEDLERGRGIEVVVVPADLGRPDTAAALWRAATGGRPIDLLVNNAGFGAQGRFEELPLDRQVEMVQLNCTALLELAHLALSDMRPRGYGAVVNVASVASFQPVPLLATYAATKAFVLSLSEALWSENRDLGVRVLALCPGRTPTEFQEVAGTGTAEGAFGVRTAEQVVEAGLRAMERGRAVEVPGIENRAAAAISSALPRSLVQRALKPIIKRALGKPHREDAETPGT